VAFSWALLFEEDFKSLTLIDAGIPGITLTNDIQPSDFKRKWNFTFQMLPDLAAELTNRKKDVYVRWWCKNQVHNQSAISSDDVASYVQSYAREGRMNAAMDYCRRIMEDIDFNTSQLKRKSLVPLPAVDGEYSIPNMAESLRPYFQKPIVISNSGHFVPEEQPDALAKALLSFLKATRTGMSPIATRVLAMLAKRGYSSRCTGVAGNRTM